MWKLYVSTTMLCEDIKNNWFKTLIQHLVWTSSKWEKLSQYYNEDQWKTKYNYFLVKVSDFPFENLNTYRTLNMKDKIYDVYYTT